MYVVSGATAVNPLEPIIAEYIAFPPIVFPEPLTIPENCVLTPTDGPKILLNTPPPINPYELRTWLFKPPAIAPYPPDSIIRLDSPPPMNDFPVPVIVFSLPPPINE